MSLLFSRGVMSRYELFKLMCTATGVATLSVLLFTVVFVLTAYPAPLLPNEPVFMKVICGIGTFTGTITIIVNLGRIYIFLWKRGEKRI